MTTSTTRQTVWECDPYGFPELDGLTVLEAAARFATLVQTSAPGTKIDWRQGEYDDQYHFVLLVPRPETDEEVAKRVDAQRMREEQTVARERA